MRIRNCCNRRNRKSLLESLTCVLLKSGSPIEKSLQLQKPAIKIPDAMAQAAAFFKSGKLQEAEQLYRAVLAIEPNNAMANNNIGLIALRVGRNDIALELFAKAVAASPAMSSLHVNLGEACRSLGKLNEAEQAYRKALELNANDGYAWGNLGALLQLRNQLDDASNALRRAVQIRPDNSEARMALAQILIVQNRPGEAVQQLDAAAKLAHMPGFPLAKLGKIYARATMPEKARKFLKAALQQDPGDSDGAAVMLATLDGGAAPERASDAHMKKLYAERALSWDQGSEAEHAYRGMLLVEQELRRHATGKLAILDAGCGTGLVGARIKDLAARLDGVDLSVHMLQRAQQKAVYHGLFAGDLLEFMRQKPASYDAIVAAATLIHFGALDAVFQLAAGALKPGGLFIFTAFPNDDTDTWSLTASRELAEGGCYTHGEGYLRRLAAQSGFEVVHLAREIHEYREAKPVDGLIVSLRKHA